MFSWITAFFVPMLIGVLMHPRTAAKMGPNGFVGYRFGVVMVNEETWQAGHRAAWPLLRTCLVLALLGSAIVLAIQEFGDAGYLGGVATMQSCAFVVIGTLGGMLKASNAAQVRLLEMEPVSSQDADA